MLKFISTVIITATGRPSFVAGAKFPLLDRADGAFVQTLFEPLQHNDILDCP